MHIPIYFNDKPLFLCNAIDPEMEKFRHHDDTVFIDEFSTHAVNAMLHEMHSNKIHAGIFLHSNLEELKHAIWKKFMIIKAGGGVVENEKHALLFMFRRGKWDLPKGKLDDGETIEECAVREVEEETGLKQIKLKEHLLTTYHTYNESGHHILKESYWYKMSVDSKVQDMKPQMEEDITELKWVSKKHLEDVLSNTFPSIKDVVKKLG
jgi:8-oxo-dGTP pyrophosphatase MutT (NUDIX family)